MLQPLSKPALSATRAAARRAPTTKPAPSRPFSYSPSPSSPSPSPSRRPPPASSSSSSPTTTAAAQTKAETTAKVRRIILTLAFAAVTFTGTIYGAGLKTQQEWNAEKKKMQEASVDDKVAILERQKLDMLRQKVEIEDKLAELRARMKENAEAEAGAGEGQVANPGKGGQ
ncbi:hypothetical protein B0I37DRAFT_411302 [Chaetomium sp. MPI-CAGE-AT-0009]|nr:hypothetical protein B0I37DRAFT_411302 [Chaetomium sp. MPI-CAGE-AT-0009]